MKNNKLLWIITLIPIIFTIVMIGFLPEQIPMHYDGQGNIDRWGSKYENFLFPCIILVMTIIMHFSIRQMEKGLNKAILIKDKKDIEQNIKVVRLVGILMACIFTVMHFVFTISALLEATNQASTSAVDFNLIVNLLLAVMFVVLGIYLPKVQQNSIMGLRTRRTLNDKKVWEKSQQFMGKAFVLAGIITAIETIIIGGMASTIIMIVIILITTFLAVIFAARIS